MQARSRVANQFSAASLRNDRASAKRTGQEDELSFEIRADAADAARRRGKAT